MTKKILVLGAGVIGLSSAIQLQKSGFEVEIWSMQTTPNTTSDVAAAFWLPFNAEPKDKVLKWSKSTFEYTQANLINDALSGCVDTPFLQIAESNSTMPWWGEIVPNLKTVSSGLPDGYSYGFEFTTILFDSSIYMGYLVNKFSKMGGTIKSKEISSVDELPDCVIVNCLGLCSKEIFNDSELYPIRGQVIVAEKNGFNKIVLDPEKQMLIVPRKKDIIIGATVQNNDDELEIREEDTDKMLNSVINTYPDFNWKIIGAKVGLRPARSSIRLETEIIGDKKIVHNYGHGGSGYTVSWGCANEVVELVSGL
jgi:D-amino-acid oxidase